MAQISVHDSWIGFSLPRLPDIKSSFRPRHTSSAEHHSRTITPTSFPTPPGRLASSSLSSASLPGRAPHSSHPYAVLPPPHRAYRYLPSLGYPVLLITSSSIRSRLLLRRLLEVFAVRAPMYSFTCCFVAFAPPRVSRCRIVITTGPICGEILSKRIACGVEHLFCITFQELGPILDMDFAEYFT
ncbi:hypothetical protein GQ55_5G184900 [Panicum hallii var. hallii]|uniref:Uncharacterized protein n=1 Tax=Panicum hallii var. hallii TaxID=1504633 RepID=A0A2T7DHR2_9POAL|nr:hypothetical protein GQ55_5G184900 [Panicum hallii var. hallii]